MEQTETSEEQFMRLNIKQNTKGSFYGEYTVRGNTIDEIKARSDQISGYMLDKLKQLNVN